MNKLEKRASFSLASIFAFRMLGLFMILPTFALYGHQQLHASDSMIGLALGIYGLTQAILQIPFGMWSDKIGRKPIIVLGLIIFCIGSIVAGSSHTITGVIIGRALQGGGAIGSTIIAMVADLTSEESRTKAMAIVGLTIGMSFTVALIIGPIFSTWWGIDGIFWLTAVLAVAGIAMVILVVPTPEKSYLHLDAEVEATQFRHILKNKELLRLDFGIFCLHFLLTACFLAIPLALEKLGGLPESEQWMLYLPVLVLAFIAALPGIIIAEAKRKMKPVFKLAIAVLGITVLCLAINHHSLVAMAIVMLAFLSAFTFLEATLPSLISKIAPAGSKGTAMGIYSSSQFLGIFAGGVVGGWLFGHFSYGGLFVGCALVAGLWLIVAWNMPKPAHLSTKLLHIDNLNDENCENIRTRLTGITGVSEVRLVPAHKVAYLKIDKKIIDPDALATF